MSYSGGGSDAGSGYCSEAEGMAENEYLKYASKAGPDRRAPLMLGHCAPPPWMVGAHDGGGFGDPYGDGDDNGNDNLLSGMMMSKLREVCYPKAVNPAATNTGTTVVKTPEAPRELSDGTVPLLQFHVNHRVLGEYYLVFVAREEDLLARRFDKVTAHVQFKIQ